MLYIHWSSLTRLNSCTCCLILFRYGLFFIIRTFPDSQSPESIKFSARAKFFRKFYLISGLFCWPEIGIFRNFLGSHFFVRRRKSGIRKTWVSWHSKAIIHQWGSWTLFWVFYGRKLDHSEVMVCFYAPWEVFIVTILCGLSSIVMLLRGPSWFSEFERTGGASFCKVSKMIETVYSSLYLELMDGYLFLYEDIWMYVYFTVRLIPRSCMFMNLWGFNRRLFFKSFPESLHTATMHWTRLFQAFLFWRIRL